MDPERAAKRRDLIELPAVGGARLYLHWQLYRYFLEHPLRLQVSRFGPWRWLGLDSETDVGQAVATQTFVPHPK